MYPNVLGLPFLHTYGLMIAIGFFLACAVLERAFGRKDLGNLAVALVLAGIAGARASYVIEHWQSEFAADPISVLYVFRGGLMFYGGLILATIVFFGWCFWRRQNPLAVGNLGTVVVPLAHAFGRIGCFCYGCCYGKVSDSPFAVVFPVGSPQYFMDGGRQLPVLPTQLFEAAALFALFALLFFVYRRYRRYTAGLYFMLYAAIRFSLEYLRGDPRATIGPFSISQAISIAMFLFGAGLLFYERASYRR